MALLFILALCCEANAVRPLVFDYTDLHKYPDNMSFTCVVEENGQRILDCEVAAFDENDELRGSYYSNEQGIVYLMVQGERSLGVLHFKVVTGEGDDKSTFTIRDINETYNFHYNDILGDAVNPFVFTVGKDNRKPLVSLGAQPATIESNYSAMEQRFIVNMDNEIDVTGLAFDMILPDGMTVIPNGMELSSARFDGEFGRGDIFSAKKESSYVLNPDGSYHVSIEKDDEVIKDVTGRLIDFYYNTSAMTDGVYPIYINNVVANYVENETEKVEKVDGFTSYVIVGTPTAQTLSVKAVLPAFVSDTLSTDNTVTTLNLAEARYILGELALDSKDLILPALEDDAVKAEKLSYTRKANSSYQWGTICLPFAIAGTEDVRLYQLSSATSTELNLSPVDNVEANSPAIFNSDSDVTFTSEDCSLFGTPVAADAVDGLTLTGVFATTQIYSGYFIANDAFWSAAADDLNGAGVKVKSFRAYFEGTGSGAKIMNIVAADADGIETTEMNHRQDDNVFYNIAGQRVSNPATGLYIVNGKVVIKK